MFTTSFGALGPDNFSSLAFKLDCLKNKLFTKENNNQNELLWPFVRTTTWPYADLTFYESLENNFANLLLLIITLEH